MYISRVSPLRSSSRERRSTPEELQTSAFSQDAEQRCAVWSSSGS